MRPRERYKLETVDLLEQRGRGPLSPTEEAQRAESLDLLWQKLTDDEQQEIEAWLPRVLGGG